jgi:protein-L-isoaspartate(D-aspartate) O-methyltransferase
MRRDAASGICSGGSHLVFLVLLLLMLIGLGNGGDERVADNEAGADGHRPRSNERQDERQKMAEVIAAYGLRDKAVLEAMRMVPRHEFVTTQHVRSAYADTPLPIGHGQTISQPYIVAEMTRQLQLKADSKVLEVGTGSGYQAAVLTEFTPHVYTIEVIPQLAAKAARRLSMLGYRTVKTKTGDGYYGWREHAPFDGIIVTCAAGQIPPPLLEQLAPGGRMIIPVGGVFATQHLILITKSAEGKIQSRALMPVRFVPLVHKE